MAASGVITATLDTVGKPSSFDLFWTGIRACCERLAARSTDVFDMDQKRTRSVPRPAPREPRGGRLRRRTFLTSIKPAPARAGKIVAAQ
jgi:hypothetical protein